MALTAAPTEPEPVADVFVEDVQIGERGNQTRIAFLCSAECALEPYGDEFLLKAVAASFDVSLADRSERIDRVRAMQTPIGAAIHVSARAPVKSVKLKTCTVAGRPAACLDLFFAEPSDAAISAGAETTPAPRADADNAEIEDEDNAEIQQNAETLAAAEETPAPVAKLTQPPLRETATDRLNKLTTLDAPARMAPPAGAILAKVQPIEDTIEVAKPAMRAEEQLAPPVETDFASRMREILGKEFSPAYCNNADATLQADAYALGAMVDVGLCAAARGDVADADAMLARLLEFTPDNYEALVGRAVIAEQAEEKGVARKYYQDALNALPPIEESNRIVEAMAALQ